MAASNRRQGRSPLRVRPGENLVAALDRTRNESVEADEESTRVVDVAEDIDAAARQHMVRRPPGWWMMRNGFWIQFRHMSDNHLENTFRLVNSRQRDTALIQEITFERARRQMSARNAEQLEQIRANRIEQIRTDRRNRQELPALDPATVEEYNRRRNEAGIIDEYRRRQGLYAGIARGGRFRAGNPGGGDLGVGSGPAQSLVVPENILRAAEAMIDDITGPLTDADREAILRVTNQSMRDAPRYAVAVDPPNTAEAWARRWEGPVPTMPEVETPDPPLPNRTRRIKE